jgi:hypothetical protein
VQDNNRASPRYKTASLTADDFVSLFAFDLFAISMDSTTIQFAEGPVRRTKSKTDNPTGGVYPIRSRSRSRGRTGSFDLQKAELQVEEDEDAGLRNENDYKHKQVRFRSAVL